METASSPSAVATPIPRATWAFLWVGVISASISAILTRYADGADPLAISFWRCAAGAAILFPFARRKLMRLDASRLRLPLLSGVFLAIHFGTWITSLTMTTVAAAVLLVSTTPVFVATAAWILFKERLGLPAWSGIALALAGTALIGGADLGGGSLGGDFLALAGGATAAGYVMVGQIARRDLGILEYAVITYASAAVLLVIACAVSGTSLGGYDTTTWIAIAALIIGPQLMGHTVINMVLKDIDATTVSVSIMAEPIIAIVLAFILFSETPSALVYPGGALILFGIYLVSVARRTPAVIVE